jgi:hypothetical protein
MSKPRSYREPALAGAVYPWRITMPAIRKLAREIAEKFRPEKIILFGSYAYGTPHQDSDVDLLVIMPARDSSALAVRILERIDPPFPVVHAQLGRTPNARSGDRPHSETLASGITWSFSGCRGLPLSKQDGDQASGATVAAFG